MLTIVIGVGLSMLLFYLAVKLDFDGMLYIAVFCLFLSVFAPLFIPLAGYHEPELKEEIELVSLNNSIESEGGGGLFYVSVTAGNVYSYRVEVPNITDKEGKMYELKTVSENVKELETNTTKAVLRVYEAKPKRWLWTFAIGASETSYVFEVPYGSISHDIALN